MDITKYIDALRSDLARSADVGGETMKAAAERLAQALDPAARLALMDALSDAAVEISAELGAATVELRLKGREPVFVVTGTARAAPVPDETHETFEDGDAVTRITFRLPESLKVRAEELAAGRGQSLNTWLVNAARAAASGGDGRHGGPGAPGRNRTGKRVQGWMR